MEVSLITTVLNEEKSILKFLESILNQNQLPDDVVIVDGGSKDKTVEIISQFAKEHRKPPIQLIKSPGANRSKARNLAIQGSKYSVIAVSDSGCELPPQWLAEITQPFNKKNIDIVAGAYQPITNTLWQRAAATGASVNFARVNPATFLPSSRSVAFRKAAWKKVGGYPEHLNTAEDLVFAQRLLKAGCKQALARSARVDWYPPSSTLKIIRQFFRYSLGDGLAGLEGHHARRYLIKTLIIFLIILAYAQALIPLPTLVLVCLLWFAFQAMRRTWEDPFFTHVGFIRGLYFWAHFGWAVILFPVTLAGFWLGFVRSIIETPVHEDIKKKPSNYIPMKNFVFML